MTPAPKRRWSFSLWTLFVVVVLASLMIFSLTQVIKIYRLEAEQLRLQ